MKSLKKIKISKVLKGVFPKYKKKTPNNTIDQTIMSNEPFQYNDQELSIFINRVNVLFSISYSKILKNDTNLKILYEMKSLTINKSDRELLEILNQSIFDKYFNYISSNSTNMDETSLDIIPNSSIKPTIPITQLNLNDIETEPILKNDTTCQLLKKINNNIVKDDNVFSTKSSNSSLSIDNAINNCNIPTINLSNTPVIHQNSGQYIIEFNVTQLTKKTNMFLWICNILLSWIYFIWDKLFKCCCIQSKKQYLFLCVNSICKENIINSLKYIYQNITVTKIQVNSKNIFTMDDILRFYTVKNLNINDYTLTQLFFITVFILKTDLNGLFDTNRIINLYNYYIKFTTIESTIIENEINLLDNFKKEIFILCKNIVLTIKNNSLYNIQSSEILINEICFNVFFSNLIKENTISSNILQLNNFELIYKGNISRSNLKQLFTVLLI